jgi:Domain of unknown function (DUF1330)
MRGEKLQELRLKTSRRLLKGNVMAKGYWIVSVDVSNPESYKLYIAEIRNAFRMYGARFVIRGGKSEEEINVIALQYKKCCNAPNEESEARL